MQPSDAHTDMHSSTVKFRDNMGSAAMSIDTPSYAHSLGLEQPGLQAGFASNVGSLSQDLAQSMSIDSGAAMQNWGTFRPGATFASKQYSLLCC